MNVPWNKYPFSKEEWEAFVPLNHSKFLKEHEFSYKHVPKCEDCNHVFFRCKCEDQEYKKKREIG